MSLQKVQEKNIKVSNSEIFPFKQTMNKELFNYHFSSLQIGDAVRFKISEMEVEGLVVSNRPDVIVINKLTGLYINFRKHPIGVVNVIDHIELPTLAVGQRWRTKHNYYVDIKEKLPNGEFNTNLGPTQSIFFAGSPTDVQLLELVNERPLIFANNDFEFYAHKENELYDFEDNHRAKYICLTPDEYQQYKKHLIFKKIMKELEIND